MAALAFLASACSHRPNRPRKTTITAHVTLTTIGATTTTTESTTTTEPATTTTPTTTSSTTPTVGNPVSFELTNYAFTLTGGRVVPGMNTVTATNTSTHPHEINFVKAANAAALPQAPNGAIDFTRVPLMDQLGVLRVAAGTTGSGMFTFTPGTYVAVCNIGAGGADPHVARGMFLELTVS